MKFLIGLACIAIIAGVGLYFYRDYQSGAAAKATQEERMFLSVCRKTRPGEKWQSMDSMNRYCKEQGYID